MYPLLTYLYIILFGYIVYILVHLFDVPTTSLLVYLFKVPIVYLLVHLFEVPPWFTYLYTCLRYPIVYLLVHLLEVPHCLLTCTPAWGTPLFTYLYNCLRYPPGLLTCTPAWGTPIVYLLVHLFEVPLRHDDLSSTALHGLSNEHTHFVPLLLNFIDGVLDLVCILLTDLLRGVLITAVFTSVGVRTGHL